MLIDFRVDSLILESEDALEAGYLSALFSGKVSATIKSIPVTEGFNTTEEKQCVITISKE